MSDSACGASRQEGEGDEMYFLLPEACWEYSLAVLLVSWNIFSTSNFIAVFLPSAEMYTQ